MSVLCIFPGLQHGRKIGNYGKHWCETLAERRINNLHPQIAFTNAFIGNYLRIEFLYEAGLYDEVITNIRKYFLPMAEKTGTLWEHDSSTGSCNHGFASYVIYWLAGIYGIFSENGPEMEVTYSLC